MLEQKNLKVMKKMLDRWNNLGMQKRKLNQTRKAYNKGLRNSEKKKRKECRLSLQRPKPNKKGKVREKRSNKIGRMKTMKLSLLNMIIILKLTKKMTLVDLTLRQIALTKILLSILTEGAKKIKHQIKHQMLN